MPDRQLAWDCGCGNGQATVAIADHFMRVVGTDPSATQIDAAEARANIDYRVEPAEHSSLTGTSASLITVAQALHWFDHTAFYAEVKRVLKPNGLFAAWAYSDCATGDAAIDRIKDRLYIDLTGPYWPPERVYVDAGYKTLPFPFVEVAAPSVSDGRLVDGRSSARLLPLMVGDAALHQSERRGSGRIDRTGTTRGMGRCEQSPRSALAIPSALRKSR